MENQVKFANWWSKLLFEKSFENQFVIPLPNPKPIQALLKSIEKRKFGKKIEAELATIKIDRPVFIVGLPRSGTSLLYNLLAAHEDAAYCTNAMNSFTETICAIEWLRKKFKLNVRGERFLEDSVEVDFGTPSEPAMFWGKWIGRDAHNLKWKEKTLADFSPEKLAEIQQDLKKILYTFGGNGKRFITKYPIFQTELRMINALFPDAHFIHIVRDGRMTANSLIKLYNLCNRQIQKIKHPDLNSIVPYPRVPKLETYLKEYGPTDLRCTAHVWEDSIDVVDAVKNDLHRFTQVRYEDLLANPKVELQKLFDFIGLKWPNPAHTEFAKEFSLIGKVHHTNQYVGYDIVEKEVGGTLKRLGY